MTVNSMFTLLGEATHPEYTTAIAGEWQLMRDAYRGEVAIKARGEKYLPMPSGFKFHPGGAEVRDAMYDAYRARARFPEIVTNAVRGMVGIAHSQDWQVDLPAALEPLRENSDGRGLPLAGLSRRVTTELLITGRYTLLADAPATGGDIYLAGYAAEQLANWSEDDDFYSLVEVRYMREGETWTDVTHKRVLELIDGRYMQRVYMDGELVEEYEPRARGGAALDMIPVAVGGAMDMDLTPDTPPLIGVARSALAQYQISADYRMQLYMTGQETAVFHNVSEENLPRVLGSGIRIGLQAADGSKDTRVEMLAPTGRGLDGHVVALDREHMEGIRSGAQLFDNTPRGQESGAARRLRFSAETATLSSIVTASAAILEKVLKQAALMAGANPDDVVVTPPANLMEGRLEPAELQALVASWRDGAMSWPTLYENLQRGRIASMDRDASEEEALLDAPIDAGI